MRNTPERSATVASFSDSADLPLKGGEPWINAAGTIRVTGLYDADGTSRTFVVGAGTHLPLRVKRIWSTGTVTIAPADVILLFQG